MTRTVLALALGAAACAPDYERAAADVQEATCAVLAGCFEAFVDVDDCVAREGASQPAECPGYDVDAALDCVAALELQAETCPPDLVSWVEPEPCSRICAP
jgi:hypothetical protein